MLWNSTTERMFQLQLLHKVPTEKNVLIIINKEIESLNKAL
jgi:hypothetical protein